MVLQTVRYREGGMHAGDHKLVTKKAVELYHELAQTQISLHFLENTRLIQSGSKLADYWPLLDRLQNWHFFESNDYLKPKACPLYMGLTINPISEGILARRVGELRDCLGGWPSRKGLRLAGRILHHIQDTSTPAHVTPVYHGIILKDRFEEYSSDHIEEHLPGLSVSKNQFQAMPESGNNLIMRVYHDAGERSQDVLRDVDRRFNVELNSQPDTVGWVDFWQECYPPEDDCPGDNGCGFKGFGRYGPLGKDFGDKKVKCSGGEYVVGEDIYQEIYREWLGKMLFDSVWALKALEACIKSHPDGCGQP